MNDEKIKQEGDNNSDGEDSAIDSERDEAAPEAQAQLTRKQH
jgi:hypothetical protein